MTNFHIVGDAFIDLFCFLEKGYDWPPKHVGGDTRLEQPITTFAGGSGVNTCTHLRSILECSKSSSDVVLHTALNPHDSHGRLLLDHAKKFGFPLINCQNADDEGGASSTAHCIVIISNNERSFLSHPGCMKHFTADSIDHFSDKTSSNVFVHIAGYFNLSGFWKKSFVDWIKRLRHEGKNSSRRKMVISLVTQHDATEEWDGNGLFVEVVPLLDFVIMNELECWNIVERGFQQQKQQEGQEEATTTKKESTSTHENWGAAYLSSLSSNTIFIVTRGPDGAVALQNGTVIAEQKAVRVDDVVDPTGAGDSFVAGFLYGISSCCDLEKSEIDCGNAFSKDSVREGLRWGCSAGTSCVLVRGASVPSEFDCVRTFYEQS